MKLNIAKKIIPLPIRIVIQRKDCLFRLLIGIILLVICGKSIQAECFRQANNKATFKSMVQNHMKIYFLPIAAVFLFTFNQSEGMPSLDLDEEGSGEQIAPQTVPNQSQVPQPGTTDPNIKKDTDPSATPPEKAVPLKWPQTSNVSEEDKKLLQSNNKEIVQLFTLAQEVCKKMDETLGNLATQRDEANTKYRLTIQELDPLLQRIGAAQAENKNP